MFRPIRTLVLIALLATPAAAAAARPASQAALAYRAAAPYAGRPNYAHAATPFQWGWFGAERYPSRVHYHSGYYGHPLRWSTHRW